MQSARSILLGAMLAVAGSTELSVTELNYDELVSFVMFENEEAYLDPTGYFCKFITLSGKDDYCRAGMTYLDPKLCKIEVTREFRATYKADGVTGREFMKTRDVFLLSSLDLSKVSDPEIDDVRKTSRQTFEAAIDIHRRETHQYSQILDENGAYRACRIMGEERTISEEVCERQGVQKPASSKEMSLLFNSSNYNRAISALKWLQKTYCPSAGEQL